MTGFEFVAAVIAAFFACGILLGVLIVVAMGGGGRGPGPRDQRLNQSGGEELPGPDDDDTPPRWPGGTSA